MDGLMDGNKFGLRECLKLSKNEINWCKEICSGNASYTRVLDRLAHKINEINHKVFSSA
jgi:hypothetical protein